MELLTEAEVHDLYKCVADASDLVRLLRERGMIAPEPEPVDPLLIEALEIVAKLNEDEDIHTFASEVRAGKRNDDLEVRIALTALRRNLELAERPTLTREMVEDAVINQRGLWSSGSKYVDCLHAALVERLK
jgi:hypothetical protein